MNLRAPTHTVISSLLILLGGCYQAHTIDVPPTTPPRDAATTTPSDAASPPTLSVPAPPSDGGLGRAGDGGGASDASAYRECGDASLFGERLSSQRDPGLPSWEVWEGCDGAPIIIHQPEYPPYPPEPSEYFRSWLDSIQPDDVSFGPCCPSLGPASGTCVIWPVDESARLAWDERRYELFVVEMWLIGASSRTDGTTSENCMALRRPGL